tara:strand:- start:70 stop:645 length:576 start_codon:yes stop_codon:yes gene_type:complete
MNAPSFSTSSIEHKIKTFQQRLHNLSDIKRLNKYSNKSIHEIYLLKRDLTIFDIQINDLMLKNNSKDVNMYKNKVEKLLKLTNTIGSYIDRFIQHKQKDSLDTLTILQFIFFPLTVITGYYGMNFMSMGAPSLKRGIFSIKKGERWVMHLMLISISIGIALLFVFDIINLNYLKFWDYIDLTISNSKQNED